MSNLNLCKLSTLLDELESFCFIQRLREFVLHFPGLVCLFTFDGKLVGCSESFSASLNVSEEDLLGEGWQKYIDPNDLNFMLTALLENKLARVDYFSNRWQSANNHIQNCKMSWRFSPWISAQHDLNYIICVAQLEEVENE